MSTRARALLILPALFLFALAGGWFAVGGSFWPEGRVHSVKVPDEVIVGRWRQAPNSRKDRTKQQIAQLEAIGYLAGYEPAGERIGVTVHAANRTSPGHNFYTSGHAQGAYLMDMDGRVLHTWELDFREVFPEYAGTQIVEERGVKDRRERWRRAHLFPNGDVLASYEGFGLVKIDKDSKSWSGPGSTRLTTTSR